MRGTPSDHCLSVLLVEDSSILAERLTEMLANIRGVELAGVVDTEADAIEVVRDRTVDVLLLDLRLRQGTGFGVLRSMSKERIRPSVIVFTNYDLAEYRHAALSLGAEFFLDKAHDMEKLPHVLEQIRERLN